MPPIRTAFNVMAHDIFTNERADVGPAKATAAKTQVNLAAFPRLTAQQAQICTVMHVSESAFLEAQARRRRGLDPLSDTILGGGGKRSVATGPSVTGGFRERS